MNLSKILLIIILCTPLYVAAELNSVELSGSISYLVTDAGVVKHEVSVSPGIDFFLNQYYYLGPDLGFIFIKNGDLKEIGFASGILNGLVLPASEHLFLNTGFGIAYVLDKIEISGYNDHSDVDHSWALTAFWGLKIKIARNAYLNVLPTYQYTKKFHVKDFYHSFYVNIGLSVAIKQKN